MPRPANDDYPGFFSNYINLVQEDDVQSALKNQFPVIKDFLPSITEEKSNYKYAPEKWTIKEMLQHMIDAERVFTYRAMCIARKETAVLPSFNENSYASNSDANIRSWQSLCSEFFNLRQSTEDLFESFTNEMLIQKGNLLSKHITSLSLGFVIVGHVYHHVKIIKERYL